MSAGPPSEDLGGALEAAWRRSDQIFDLVEESAALLRPIPLRQPLLFYMGHLPAFAWNHLACGVLHRERFAPELDELFEAGIDPRDDADPAVADDAGAWPARQRVLAYRERVREELGHVLAEPALQPVLPMVLEHELMHHETLMYMLGQLPAWARRPYPRGPAEGLTGSVQAGGRIRIPAGPARLGAARDGRFRWDNEQPELIVPTDAFEIDVLPVTNREFREFVSAGGYGERRLWSDEAWRWLARRPSDTPRIPAEAEDAWPAYVTHCEAQAFARFSGARLPSEAEFHRAAFATPDGGLRAHPWGDKAPGPEHGNLAFLRFGPAPVGAFPEGQSAFGVHELVGNGWEWTATPFGPFPGFEPLARYAGYSADFFDERHFVLLGASWATDKRLVRRSFRNWFQPHYPYVFAKFRLSA